MPALTQLAERNFLLYAAGRLDFTFDELCTLALNGFEAAFIPWEQRVTLLESVSKEMQSLALEIA